MKILKKIKKFIKRIIRGKEQEPAPPVQQQTDKLIIRTYKNGNKTRYMKYETTETINDFCALIQNFAKWDDYNIVYNFPAKSIDIYFNVKKSADFENINNEKEDKKK